MKKAKEIEKLMQQVHDKDDGEVVLVADKKREWKLCCKKCEQVFDVKAGPFPFFRTTLEGSEFKDYVPAI